MQDGVDLRIAHVVGAGNARFAGLAIANEAKGTMATSGTGR